MFVSPDRIIRSAAVALGVLALTSPVTGARVATDAHATAVSGQSSRSDAAQITVPDHQPAASLVHRSDAAQRTADEGTVRSADRSDAAQRVPGESAPVRQPLADTPPAVAVDDGFDWPLAGIGLASAALLALMAAAAFRYPRPRVS